jgi:hypothetical protein
MPKVVIEFSLPDEREEYESLMNAQKDAHRLDSAMREIFSTARMELKHGPMTVESMEGVIQKIKELSWTE